MLVQGVGPTIDFNYSSNFVTTTTNDSLYLCSTVNGLCGPHHLQKNSGQNHQTTTKVTLNEPPKINSKPMLPFEL